MRWLDSIKEVTGYTFGSLKKRYKIGKKGRVLVEEKTRTGNAQM
jgi:hypothetical protein